MVSCCLLIWNAFVGSWGKMKSHQRNMHADKYMQLLSACIHCLFPLSLNPYRKTGGLQTTVEFKSVLVCTNHFYYFYPLL